MRWSGLRMLLLIGLLGTASQAQSRPTSFEGSRWIWSPLSDPAAPPDHYTAGSIYFRAKLEIPAHAKVESAQIAITADNLFVLYLNGKPVGESDADNSAWGKPRCYEVGKLLTAGQNLIAVHAVNTLPGPAALIARMEIRLADGKSIPFGTSDGWKCSDQAQAKWNLPGFDDGKWQPAYVVGPYGVRPWGKPAAKQILPAGQPIGKVIAMAQAVERGDFGAAEISRSQAAYKLAEKAPENYAWPGAVIFLGDDCSLYRPARGTGTPHDTLGVTIFNPRKSRGFPEHDLPAPMKMGRKLFLLSPAAPGSEPRVMLDAGSGAIGSPSVSFDGKWIYVSMAFDGESFFHIYRLPAEGGKPQKLTDGPFHDIDPAEMPDGRIVFTSTRSGTFDEYHSAPSRGLFSMKADGSDVKLITSTIIFDNEPEILPDGRILFIRSDNFFDRGKVETLLHAVHPDGTEGYTEFALDNAPEYGNRLRAFTCGSPAPMADGRVAFVSAPGITVGYPGFDPRHWKHLAFEAGDVAALPDGRLICTVATRTEKPAPTAKQKNAIAVDHSYETLGIVDPEGNEKIIVPLFRSPQSPLHSPVYLGPRARPQMLPSRLDPSQAGDVRATGILYCQNARLSRNETAGWSHVRAIRVLAGKGLTVRSSHAYIVHAGSEVVELGTVPLAPDGSFAVEVPADTPIAFQAVDAEGRSELNEMSWIFVRPGEKRGCVGCHANRQTAPPSPTNFDAMRVTPLKLTGQGRPHRFRGNNPAVTGLMELQFDRFREVASLNRHSETANPLATWRDEVAELIQILREGAADSQCADFPQREKSATAIKISAAQRLAIFRDAAAAPALAECLEHKDRELRVASAMALATCGTRASVAPLLDALLDKDPLVAQAAGIALENLTGEVLPFNAFGPREDRKPAVQAWRQWFADHPWDQIEQALVHRLASEDRDKVRRAAAALGHTGGDAARQALRAYVTRAREFNPYPQWKQTHRSDGTRFNSREDVNPRTLQAAVRSLGYLRDAQAVPLLKETLARHGDPEQSNLFLTEACAEALGFIGTPDAELALIESVKGLKDYFYYVGWYGDHSALYACHASPVHFFIAQSLDQIGSTRVDEIIPNLIRSLPTDPDRALFPSNDDCEAIVGRIIRRSAGRRAVIETCLSILGDSAAGRDPAIEAAIATTYAAWGGKPDPENRAAHLLSAVCRDPLYEPRIRAAFDRYRTREDDPIARVGNTALPQKLPIKNWVCFFLARSLGNLADPASLGSLLAALEQPQEAAGGYPDPLGPGVLFLHNGLTPCWRAGAAWAIGRIGDRRAAPALLKTVADLKNAVDTRHCAAVALGEIADPQSLVAIEQLAKDYPEFSTRKALQRAALRTQHTAPKISNPASSASRP